MLPMLGIVSPHSLTLGAGTGLAGWALGTWQEKGRHWEWGICAGELVPVEGPSWGFGHMLHCLNSFRKLYWAIGEYRTFK